MERFFTHKGRHVVVSTGEEVEGKVPVRWVALTEGVSGVAKRGRRPRYTAPVDVSELVEVTDSELLAKLAALPAPVVTETPAETPDPAA